MAYTPDNNPYIPGDPYSYDLKWQVDNIKHMQTRFGELDEQVQEATDQAEKATQEADRAAGRADFATEEADRATQQANNAAASAEAAADSEAAAKDYADNIADPVSGLVTSWLNDHISPGIAVDNTLTVSGAAADAKITGTNIKAAANSRAALCVSDYEYPAEIIDGVYMGTNGNVVTAAGYFRTEPIPLLPGQAIEILSDLTETYVCEYCIVDISNNIVSLGQHGGSSAPYRLRYLNRNDSVVYISAGGKDPDNCSVHILTPDYSSDNILEITEFRRTDGTVTPTQIPDGGTVANYVSTSPIFVKAGSRIAFSAYSAASIPALYRCTKQGKYISDIVTGTGTQTWYNIFIPEDMYIIGQYYQSRFMLFNIQSPVNNEDPHDKRRGTITFIFDDGHANDSIIYDLFNSKGLRCGFALISSIFTDPRSAEYLKYQKEGFSILSHSTDADPMSDGTINPGVINTKMQESLNYLSARGFNIKGWVTPSSTLAPNFNNLAQKYYNYAYVVYYGTYTGENVDPPYNTLQQRYNLYRVDCNSSLENMKAAVDLAIANRGFLTFYYHSQQIDETHRQRISDLLDYINGKISTDDVRCLAPNEAFTYFYTPRLED